MCYFDWIHCESCRHDTNPRIRRFGADKSIINGGPRGSTVVLQNDKRILETVQTCAVGRHGTMDHVVQYSKSAFVLSCCCLCVSVQDKTKFERRRPWMGVLARPIALVERNKIEHDWKRRKHDNQPRNNEIKRKTWRIYRKAGRAAVDSEKNNQRCEWKDIFRSSTVDYSVYAQTRHTVNINLKLRVA